MPNFLGQSSGGTVGGIESTTDNTVINSTDLSVNDSNVIINADNTGNTDTSSISFKYNDGSDKWAGIGRYTNGELYAFCDSTTEPNSSTDLSALTPCVLNASVSGGTAPLNAIHDSVTSQTGNDLVLKNFANTSSVTVSDTASQVDIIGVTTVSNTLKTVTVQAKPTSNLDIKNNTALSTISLTMGGDINITPNTGNKTSFSQTLESTGVINSINSSQSTNQVSGAIQSQGGLGIAKRLNVGEGIKTFSITDSSSVSTGAIICNGGLGVAKKVFIGDDVDISGNITVSGTVDGIDINTDVSANTTHSGLTSGNPHSVTASDVGLSNVTNESKSTMFTDSQLTMTDNTANALTVKEGVNDYITCDTTNGSELVKIHKDLQTNTITGLTSGAVKLQTNNTLTKIQLDQTANDITVFGNLKGQNAWETISSIKSTSTTDSSSVSTGAIICNGGLGVAKKVFIGDDVDITGNITCNGVVKPQSIEFFGLTGTNNIELPDNQVDSCSFQEGVNKYLTFDTTNSAERILAYEDFYAQNLYVQTYGAGSPTNQRPLAMTSSSSNGYVSSASNESFASANYRPFNNIISGADFFTTQNKYNISTGAYIGTATATTYDGASTIYGEWLQFQFSSEGSKSIDYFHVHLPGGLGFIDTAWQSFRVLKSDNGTTWTTAQLYSNLVWTQNDLVINFDTTQTSEYWRFVMTNVGQTGGTDRQYFQATEIYFYRNPVSTEYFDVSGGEVNINAPLNFTQNATNLNVLKIPDNISDSFSIQQGNNKYLTFDTTDSSEKISMGHNLEFSNGSLDSQYVSNFPIGEAYFEDNTTETPITILDTYERIDDGTFVSGKLTSFTHNGSGRLTYTGTPTISGMVRASITIDTAGTTEQFQVKLFKNNLPQANATVNIKTAGTFQDHNGSISCFTDLATNDYLELFIRNRTDTDNVLVTHYNLSVLGIVS